MTQIKRTAQSEASKMAFSSPFPFPGDTREDSHAMIIDAHRGGDDEIPHARMGADIQVFMDNFDVRANHLGRMLRQVYSWTYLIIFSLTEMPFQ
jgi:hypothetical protein